MGGTLCKPKINIWWEKASQSWKRKPFLISGHSRPKADGSQTVRPDAPASAWDTVLKYQLQSPKRRSQRESLSAANDPR